jgi:hypothetical protein
VIAKGGDNGCCKARNRGRRNEREPLQECDTPPVTDIVSWSCSQVTRFTGT